MAEIDSSNMDERRRAMMEQLQAQAASEAPVEVESAPAPPPAEERSATPALHEPARASRSIQDIAPPPPTILGAQTNSPTFQVAQPAPTKQDTVDNPFKNMTREQIDAIMKMMEATEAMEASDTAPAPVNAESRPETDTEPPAVLHKAKHDMPTMGWQGLLAKLFKVNVGKGELEQIRESWLNQVQRPIDGNRTYATISVKGGVGKTSVGTGVATVLKVQTGDNVAMLDIDPNGTLKHRAKQRQPADVQTLAQHIRSGAKDIRAYAAPTLDGVDIFGSRTSIESSELDADDVETLIGALKDQYDFTIIDMPIYTQNSPAVRAAIRHVDALLFIVPPTVESLSAIDDVTDAVRLIGGDHLVNKIVYVVSNFDPYLQRHGADVEDIVTRLHKEGHNVVQVPFDTAFRADGSFEFANVNSSTMWQFVQIAAAVNSLTRVRELDTTSTA